MNPLESNARRVRNLSPVGIWLFIIGRVLVAAGIGILAMAYFSSIAFPAALPLIVVGVILLLVALKGLLGRADAPPK
jgi:hypothetical protein